MCGLSRAQRMREREATLRMSHTDPTSIRCELHSELTVQRRVTTELWNRNERERIISLRAYEIFCTRGCEHGAHIEDWLTAERELLPKEGDVVFAESDSECVLSIASRPNQSRILVSVAPSNVLILWKRDENEGAGDDVDSYSTLVLAPLPRPIDPEKAEVTYREGRAWLDLPCCHSADPALNMAKAKVSRKLPVK